MDPSASPDFFRKIIDNSVYAWCVIDDGMIVTYASPASLDLLGYTPSEMVGRSALDLIVPEDHEAALSNVADVTAHPGTGVPVVIGLRHRDGTTRYVEIGAQVRLDDPGVAGIILRLRPYDDQHLLEQYLEALATSVPVEQTLRPLAGSIKAQHMGSEVAIAYDWDGRHFQSVVHTGLPDPLVGAVAAAGTTPWSSAISTGATVIAATLDELVPELREAATRAGLSACWTYPVPVPPDGARLACLIVWRLEPGAPRIGHGAALEHSVWLAALGFERRHSEDLLRHAALHDTLTGIPNRTHFYDHLGRLTERPGGHGRCAVLLADLDGFKDINDTYGHGVGDAVLGVIAKRLEAAVRPGDLVARFGGDEFAVLCTDLAADADAFAMADRLIDAVSRPIAIGSVTALVGLSVGVAFHDPAETTESRITEAADHALYQAKQAGKGRWAVAPAG